MSNDQLSHILHLIIVLSQLYLLRQCIIGKNQRRKYETDFPP